MPASILLTGDNPETARAIGGELGLEGPDVLAGVLPDAKAGAIERLKAENPRGRVAMVGDGLNDAPALAAADVGIALGTGTDLAKAVADIVIATGDLRAVPRALRLGRSTLTAIRQNLFWAFAYNTLGIPAGGARAFRPLRADDRRGGHVAQLGHRRRALRPAGQAEAGPVRSGPSRVPIVGSRSAMSSVHQSVKNRIASLDQFRGYTVAGMLLVNFIGGFREVGIRLEASQYVLQLCRHDHAAVLLRGRLRVPADVPPPA